MIKRFSLLLLCVPAGGLFAACSSAATSTSSGAVPAVDGGTADAPRTDAQASGTSCSKARDDLLIPIGKVSTGAVSVVSDTGGTKTIYVDASAGGQQSAIKNPRVYVDLGAGAKVEISDTDAPASTAWDLALKRDKIFTNSGDAGAGKGGATEVQKSFSSVSAMEADAQNLQQEKFFDAECNPQVDATGSVSTTFSGWYDYDQVTHIPTPKDVAYVVRGGTGKKYKVGIKSYQGASDGGTGTATGVYILQVTAL